MKKIFISTLALAVGACGLFERDSSNYWLNHMHNYSTYPVYYYTDSDFDVKEKLVDSDELVAQTYERNVVVSAKVGQPMVESKTVDVKRYKKYKIVAQNDAVISNIGEEVKIKKGQEFMPIGEVKIDGKYYILIEGDNNGSILLVDEDGNVMNKINAMYGKQLLLSKTYSTIYPENLKIIQKKETRTDMSKPKANFKIIYDGYNNGMFEMTYVNYSNSEEGEKDKYIYKMGDELIDVNGVKMRITGVFPDRIEYMLLD